MTRSPIAAGASAVAGALALSACATPQYGVYQGPPVAAPSQDIQPATGPGVAMAPIPNPRSVAQAPAPAPRPTTPVSQSTLPPVIAPPRPAPVPVVARPPLRPTTYRVRGGDTLFSISRQFALNPQALAEANNMTFQSILRNGQTLRIPGAAPDLDASTRVLAQASTPTPATPAVAPPRPAAAPPAATSPTRPAPGQIIPTTPPPGASDVATLGRGLFQWPLTGAVLQRFGPLGTGQRNDGINIAAVAGAPVRAAAAGEVAYTGNSVPGFGNLVLIRHPGGWVTAYGHLQAATVRMRQAVTQGEQIGAAGQTGAVGQPQLHFEIRYAPTARDRARAVDPMLLLPAAG